MARRRVLVGKAMRRWGVGPSAPRTCKTRVMPLPPCCSVSLRLAVVVIAGAIPACGPSGYSPPADASEVAAEVVTKAAAERKATVAPNPKQLDAVNNGEPKAAAEALGMMIGGRFEVPLPPELEGILLRRIAEGHVWAAEDLIHVGGVEAVAKAMAATEDDAIVKALASSIGLRFRLSRDQVAAHEAQIAAKALVSKLGTSTEARRLLTSLQDIGPDAADVARVPVAALLDDPELRDAAAHTLAAIGAGDTVDALFTHLGDEDAEVRIAVARAIGCSGRPVVPRLQEALGDRNPRVKETAIRALAHVGPDAAASVDTLTKLLGGSNSDLVSQAALTLGAIGKAATSALPALRSAADKAATRSPTADVDLRIAITSIEGGIVERPSSCTYRAPAP